jgi:hypothetical protein
MLKCINYDAPNLADFYHASVMSSHSRQVLYSIKLKLHKTREDTTRKTDMQTQRRIRERISDGAFKD